MLRLRKKQKEKEEDKTVNRVEVRPLIAGLENRLAQLEARVRELESEIEDMKEARESDKQISARLRELQNERIEKLEMSVGKLTEEINKLIFNYKEMTDQVRNTRAKINVLEPVVLENVANIEKLKREYSSYRKALKKMLEKVRLKVKSKSSW